MAITTDFELKAAIGLSDEQIGHFIGKTRQAVNRGLKSSQKENAPRYFKPEDLLAIFNELKAIDHQALNDVAEYIKSQGIDLNQIKINPDSAPIEIVNFTHSKPTDIIAIIPDFYLFSTKYAKSWARLVKLITHEQVPTTVYFGTDMERKSFNDLIVNTARVQGDVDVEKIDCRLGLLKDTDRYTFMFNVAFDPAAAQRRFLTCINDKYVEPDQRLYAKVFHYALTEVEQGPTAIDLAPAKA